MSTVAAPPILEVVSGLLVRECSDGRRRALFIQRAGGGTYPYTFASPGGKIETGETEFDALRRELREEIGLGRAPRVWPWLPRMLRARILRRSAKVSAPGPWSLLYEHFGYRSGSQTARFRLRCFYVLLPPDAVVDVRPLDGVIGLAWLSAENVEWLPLAQADAASRNEIVALLRREIAQT